MSLPLLAAKLVELRQQYGYSQQEIADYLGMTREGYSHYERNAREPGLEVLVKLCKLYPIDISELVNDELVPVSFSGLEEKTGDRQAEQEIPPAVIIKNMNHFLKLFTGKNAAVDISDLNKEDIALLAAYKKLNKQNQKETRQFVKYKAFTEKHKEI